MEKMQESQGQLRLLWLAASHCFTGYPCFFSTTLRGKGPLFLSKDQQLGIASFLLCLLKVLFCELSSFLYLLLLLFIVPFEVFTEYSHFIYCHKDIAVTHSIQYHCFPPLHCPHASCHIVFTPSRCILNSTLLRLLQLGSQTNLLQFSSVPILGNI